MTDLFFVDERSDNRERIESWTAYPVKCLLGEQIERHAEQQVRRFTGTRLTWKEKLQKVHG